MTTLSHSNSNNGKWLIILAIALIAGTLALGAIGNLELSFHATNSHSGEVYTPAEIQGMVDQNKCRNLECFACPNKAKYMVLCQLPESDLWGGLVISMTSGKIITGFAASWVYWQSAAKRDSCYPILLSP